MNLTLDVIRRAALLLDEAKPLPRLFSTFLWPEQQATVVEHEEGRRIIASPYFWRRIPMKHSATIDPTLNGFAAYMGLQIIDLDLDANHDLRRDIMLDIADRLLKSEEEAARDAEQTGTEVGRPTSFEVGNRP